MPTNAEIRASLVAFLNEVAARGRNGLGTAPLTVGSRFMRRGRFVVVTTSATGVVIFARVSRALEGMAAIIGASAQVTPCTPQTLRDAWAAGDNTETNVDPSDGAE